MPIACVKTLPLEVALDVKAAYRDRIRIDIGIQPLEGVIDPKAREFFEKACERADFVGALPSRDRPQPEKHLDIVLKIAKDLGKPLDVHVDQEEQTLTRTKPSCWRSRRLSMAWKAVSLGALHLPGGQAGGYAGADHQGDAGCWVAGDLLSFRQLSMKSLDRNALLHGFNCAACRGCWSAACRFISAWTTSPICSCRLSMVTCGWSAGY